MAKRKSKTYCRKTSKIYLTILGILLVLIAGVGVNSAVHFASWYPTFDSLKGQWDQYFGQTADLSSVDAPNLFAGEEDELAVYYFDVGQGDAILLKQNDATMLIDTGDNGMENQLLQQLDALEITQLDVLVCTHYHADHIGGAAEVLQNIAVDRVLLPSGSANTQTYEDMLDVIDQKGIPTSFPKIGYTGELGEADYQVVGPQTEDNDNQNDNSLMIRFQFGNASFLFTGDGEATEEADILATQHDLPADVLKVGHHGSSTSTSPAFLQAVHPVCAVISCGAGNDYGHPHQETLDKLSEAGVTVYRTDLSGTITMLTDGATIRVYVDGQEQQSFPAGQNASTTESSSASSETASQPQATGYIGNVNSKKFHLPSCSNLPAEENQVSFSSREDAVNAGYTPCGSCNP